MHLILKFINGILPTFNSLAAKRVGTHFDTFWLFFSYWFGLIGNKFWLCLFQQTNNKLFLANLASLTITPLANDHCLLARYFVVSDLIG